MGKGTLGSKFNRKIGKKWVDNLFKLDSGGGAEAPKASPLLNPPLQSRVASFTTHNVPEFSRKFHFLRLFWNTGFCSKRNKRKFSSFCFAEFIDS